MKYIQLKKDLENNIRSAYLISGNDRFLCYSALETIKRALNISMPQMNEVILSGDSTLKEDIVRAANVFPFMDKYRLVQVNDFSSKTKSKKDQDELLAYLNKPMEASVIVFFNLDSADALKPYLSLITEVNCDKLSPDDLRIFLSAKFRRENVNMSGQALDKLILYCNNDMARITGEAEKLKSYSGGREITESDVELLVVEDKEYQVFELGEFIARGDKKKALDLVYTLQNGKSGFSLLAPLYNNYRRMLFCCVNKDKTDDELAALLSVKPYAIKMTKGQARYFTARKLKQIVDLLYEMDSKIKTGKIKEDIAVKTAVVSILKIRG